MTDLLINGQVARKSAIGLAVLILVSACQATSPVQNASGTPTVNLDPSTQGPVAGIGIEGQDIASMTDQMVRDMLRNPTLAGQQMPPRVIIDGEYFENQSSQRINKNIITDILRNDLNRAANGRMLFVARHLSGMVAKERDLKRQGVVDVGTTKLTQAQAGGDYRLGGRIASLDSRDAKTGVAQRYTQILFEMIDLESGIVVWTDSYRISRAGADDVIYR